MLQIKLTVVLLFSRSRPSFYKKKIKKMRPFYFVGFLTAFGWPNGLMVM